MFDVLEWLVPLLIGAVFVGLAVVGTFESVRLIVRGELAAGTVVGYKSEEDCFFPVIEFTDRNGELRRFTSSVGRGIRHYAEGTRVTVVYDVKRNREEIRAFWFLWLFPAVMTFLAAVFLAFAIRALSQ